MAGHNCGSNYGAKFRFEGVGNFQWGIIVDRDVWFLVPLIF